MGNVEQINIDNDIEVIDTETIQLKETSKRYISNKKALFIAKKYEKRFEEIGKKYDIDIAVDKKTGLYYIIFGENALDIGLDVEGLEKNLEIILNTFTSIPSRLSKTIEKLSFANIGKLLPQVLDLRLSKFITELEIQNNISENNTFRELEAFYNENTSQTETKIEKEARKLALEQKKYYGRTYKVLKYGENIIFGIEEVLEENAKIFSLAIGNSVKFKKTELLKITKDVIEGRRSIENITKDEIMIRISSQSKMEAPIAEQKKQELQRFKDFLTACINLKKHESYPGSFGLKE